MHCNKDPINEEKLIKRLKSEEKVAKLLAQSLE